MTHVTLAMCLYLFAPPTTDAAPDASDATAEAGPEADTVPRVSVIAQLERATTEIDEDPARTIELLSTALETFEMFEHQYTDDPHALELRTLSQLHLARAQLASEDESAASATIFEAIRDQHGGVFPADHLGPTLASFYLEQRELLMSQGHAVATLAWPTACELVINGKRVDAPIIELPLGTYRVHLRPLDGSAETDMQLELETAGEVVTIKPVVPFYDGQPEVAPPSMGPETTSPKKKGMSLEVATNIGIPLMGVGGVLTVAGGALTGLAVYQLNNDNLWGILTVLLGPAVGLTGLISLGVGGGIYGSAVRRSREQAKVQLGPITPVLVFDRNGGRAGVSMRF